MGFDEAGDVAEILDALAFHGGNIADAVWRANLFLRRLRSDLIHPRGKPASPWGGCTLHIQ